MDSVTIYFNDLPELVEFLRIVYEFLTEFWRHCGLLTLFSMEIKDFVLAVSLGSNPSFIIATVDYQRTYRVRIPRMELTVTKGICYPCSTPDEACHLYSFNFLEIWDDLN